MNKHNYSTSGLCRLLYTIRLLFNTTNYRQYCSTWQICHVATCTSSASLVLSICITELSGIDNIGLGIELELPSSELELNWNCHHRNWNWN